jgi:predicted transport protein
MKCFSIKHFGSLEYIAEKKKKAFAIIKKQRQKLKTLNYLELNTLKDMKDINNM